MLRTRKLRSSLPSKGTAVKVVGYGDSLSVEAGGSIAFKVSCTEPTYHAELVQPSHLAQLKRSIASDFAGDYPGRVQALLRGSFIRFAHDIERPADLGLDLWVYPTAPIGAVREILAWEDGSGLFQNAQGLLELRLGNDRLAMDVPLRAHEWYLVSARIENGQVSRSGQNMGVMRRVFCLRRSTDRRGQWLL